MPFGGAPFGPGSAAVPPADAAPARAAGQALAPLSPAAAGGTAPAPALAAVPGIDEAMDDAAPAGSEAAAAEADAPEGAEPMDAEPAAGPAGVGSVGGDPPAAAAAGSSANAAALAAAARPPQLWQRDEAMCRTAAFGQLCGSQPWRPTPLGGSDLQRPLRSYTADSQPDGSRTSCNKYQVSHINLLPGIMVIWCLDCGICRYFGVMERAESPRHPFEVLYTRCAEAPRRFVFDNGCNVHAYMLNREPAFFQPTRMLIDQVHFRTHTNCAPDFNTGCHLHDTAFANPCCIPADISIHAADADSISTRMQVTTLTSRTAPWRSRKTPSWRSWTRTSMCMYYVRYAMYRLNKRQRQAAAKQSSGGRRG